MLEEHIAGPRGAAFRRARVTHLLGLDEGAAHGKEELFGAWRLLFERMSDSNPVVLLFEDLQWADATLVEFVSYLLEWSRNHAIYVLCHARPELQERHPEFGRGRGIRQRCSSSLSPPAQWRRSSTVSSLVCRTSSASGS